MKTGLSGGIAQRFLNSKLTPLLVGASVAAGVGGLLTTPREEEPQIRVPMIDVMVGLPGASPAEVDRRVAQPLERAIWEVPGVEYVYSASQSDGAMITARFEVGTEPETAMTRLYAKLLANQAEAPAGATPPMVTLHGINEVPILTITLSGGEDAGDGYLLRQQAVELAAELKRIDDVAETWVIGGAPREVRVTLDPQALAARGLSAGAVVHVLQAANAELPAGALLSANRSIPVRVGHLLQDVEQVRNVVVGVVGERPILLRDVANIEDGPAEPDQYVSFLAAGGDGLSFEPAVTIAIAKREGKNAATIAHHVMQRVEELRGRVVADDVRITVTRDYGETATEKSGELLLHILIATVGVVLLVWLALGWREAVVVLGGRAGHARAHAARIPALRLHAESHHALRARVRDRHPGRRRDRRRRKHRAAPGHEAQEPGRRGRDGGRRGRQPDHPRHVHRDRGHPADGVRVGADGPLHAAHPGRRVGGDAVLARRGVHRDALPGGSAGEGARARRRSRTPRGSRKRSRSPTGASPGRTDDGRGAARERPPDG